MTSVSAEQVQPPDLSNSRWCELGELRSFEARLLAARQEDPAFSDRVRLDQSDFEQLRNKELVPFLYYAKHRQLADLDRFRKVECEFGADIEYLSNSEQVYLQITKAFLDYGVGDAGYQHRLMTEKLTRQGFLWGAAGKFRRQGQEIARVTSWQETRDAAVRGLLTAFTRKKHRGAGNIILLIHAERFYAVLDPERFAALCDEAATAVGSSAFARTVVIDYGPDFYWERIHRPD